jgi:hypothetical protein
MSKQIELFEHVPPQRQQSPDWTDEQREYLLSWFYVNDFGSVRIHPGGNIDPLPDEVFEAACSLMQACDEAGIRCTDSVLHRAEIELACTIKTLDRENSKRLGRSF